MTKITIESDLSKDEVCALIGEIKMLHRDVFKKHLLITHRLDVDRKDLYDSKNPQFRDRTRKRLLEIQESGMEEVGIGEFGCPGLFSGMYIENVWSYTDEEFASHMEWVRQMMANETTDEKPA